MIVTRRVSRATNRAAFTLMEVMVAAAILVILAGVASVAIFRYLDDAKINAAKVGATKIQTAVNSYRVNNGSFPETLEVLIQPMNNMAAFLEPKDLLDPWQNPYIYEPGTLSTTGVPLIYSQGPNPGDPTTQVRNWD